LLAKKVAENPNPSGTAPVLTALNVTGMPVANVLARLLFTRRGVQALTRGFEMALLPRGAVRPAQIGELTRVVREVVGEPVPAFAGEPPADPAPGKPRPRP
jgi:hypothetical protein